MRKRNLNKELLIVAILLISTAPLYAQRQQQDVGKLKADARNVVGTIANDKAKRPIARLSISRASLNRLIRRRTAKRLRCYLRR
jgi:hypothetical protein